MDSQLGDTAWGTLPERVREDLRDVDRLRAVWAAQRQGHPLDVRGAARRELTRDRVREWGGGPELTELLLTGASASGEPMTGPHIAALAGRVAALPETEWTPGTRRALRPFRTALSTEHTLDLARAAVVPAHPVVRAAHTYAECVRILTEATGGPEATGEGGDGFDAPWALPWVLASRVLQRADLPPLLLDPGCPPPGPCTKQDPEERLAPLVSHMARLVTGALRGELGWARGDRPGAGAPVPPLTAVTRRRVLDYVRSRRDPVALILRALDPGASATVSSGDGGAATARGGPEPLDRALFTPGAAYWWTCLELVVGDTSLSLYVLVQDVGSPPSGVLAVTANARLVTPEGDRETLEMSRSDSVTVMPTDCVDDRWPQVRDLVDEAVSRSMNELTRL
ncbi:hypothetical protein [Nocardiopsis ganjiahuensis]|uniref:hypothetical protein n=1 Tax=Nocardiopsis ganjiahuensis TaxID=239984 RepID=UPI00034543AE|nr:hypothetical protein [Nocardiopsis ganjiahuensis]